MVRYATSRTWPRSIWPTLAVKGSVLMVGPVAGFLLGGSWGFALPALAAHAVVVVIVNTAAELVMLRRAFKARLSLSTVLSMGALNAAVIGSATLVVATSEVYERIRSSLG
ncbi:hypothetical protein PSR1_01341 [Anaeromyxobacter sp. PSR-1]|nr:hypothetical protein PSR1_01341 [Anaeromyxobacter sp. PSR-1]